jgi:hypothetical protein
MSSAARPSSNTWSAVQKPMPIPAAATATWVQHSSSPKHHLQQAHHAQLL